MNCIIVVALKRIKRAMPKFYRGKQLGFSYKACAIGWRRLFPLSLFPYLTGDRIDIHLSLKPLLEGITWQQGTIGIDPPVLSRDDPNSIASFSVFPIVEFQDWPKEVLTPPKYKFPTNKWWSRTIPLGEGVRFGQPCNIECGLSFQNLDDGIEQTAPMHIADIEVVSRGPFLTNIFLWLIGIIVAFLTGYFLNVIT